jgi:predicted RNase H-like nuclease (RuvC/YqgF family)
MNEKDLMSNPFQTNAKFENVKEESEFDRILKILLVPANSGVYISRYDIRKLGMAFQVKIPVKERKEMLRDLFMYAKQMDRLKDLLDTITEFIDYRINQYKELEENYPRIEKLTEKWISKAEKVKSMLANMKKELDIYPPHL